jgi:branched-subunit amino acid ABC-type transport system permease component
MEWLQRTVDGLLEAGPYALIGLGLTLGFGILRRIDLAYGATAMLAAYVGSWLHVHLGLPAPVVWTGVILSALLIGAYVQWVCFPGTDDGGPAPQRGRESTLFADTREVTALAASFALWMQLEQFAVNLQPRHLHPFPDLSASHEWSLGALVLRPDRLFVAVFTLAAVWLFARWIDRSRPGLGLRAVSSLPVAAHLSGLPVGTLRRLGFALACALSGVATCAVLSIDGQVTPMFGMWMMLKGLTVALIGGLGSLRGVLLGAALLGVVESHAQALGGPLARDAVAWGLLLLALLLRGRFAAGRGAGDLHA